MRILYFSLLYSLTVLFYFYLFLLFFKLAKVINEFTVGSVPRNDLSYKSLSSSTTHQVAPLSTSLLFFWQTIDVCSTTWKVCVCAFFMDYSISTRNFLSTGFFFVIILHTSNFVAKVFFYKKMVQTCKKVKNRGDCLIAFIVCAKTHEESCDHQSHFCHTVLFMPNCSRDGPWHEKITQKRQTCLKSTNHLPFRCLVGYTSTERRKKHLNDLLVIDYYQVILLSLIESFKMSGCSGCQVCKLGSSLPQAAGWHKFIDYFR